MGKNSEGRGRGKKSKLFISGWAYLHPKCEHWSLTVDMSKLLISCQVASKAHYLPEKPDSLLFIHILGNFQDREDLSGIVAPLMSIMNRVCFCCYCCEPDTTSEMWVKLYTFSQIKSQNLHKFEILVFCCFIVFCWCQVKVSNAAMHPSAVAFKAAAPPRAVLVCASLKITGIFLQKKLDWACCKCYKWKRLLGHCLWL